MDKKNEKLNKGILSLSALLLSLQLSYLSSEVNNQKNELLVSIEYKPNIDIPFEY